MKLSRFLRPTILSYPVIVVAVIWQYTVVAALLWDPSAINATSMHILLGLVPSEAVWYILGVSSTLATLAFLSPHRLDTLAYLMPQQILLYISAAASAQAIWLGHFGDGVERSRAFILADQSLPILVAFAHTWALLQIYVRQAR